MLIKEYRVPLPLTVEEYRIAQLYMIAKKSRDESHGEGSGVEIIINEPYTNGPGGNGQYTKKNYHVGNHLPGWIKSVLPKSALTVEEEAWNAYPYTRTRYTCPFIEKFSLDIETYYHPDNGYQENVFQLSNSELRSRVVDVIDIVKDQLIGVDYIKDEDPKLFVSEKTGRGPLRDNWLEEYWQEVNGKIQPTSSNMSLMCAYKICRVEFRYWGMQTKLEKFIHDVALRKTMLRAHRQAWAWQDEWCGLTIEDIREIEKQTQLALARKMGDVNRQREVENDEEDQNTFSEGSIESLLEVTPINIKALPRLTKVPSSEESSPPNNKDEQVDPNSSNDRSRSLYSLHKSQINHLSKVDGLHLPKELQHSYDLQVANWRMERLEVDSKSNSDEEFFDCMDSNEVNFLTKWSSLDLLTENVEHKNITSNTNNENDSIFNQDFLIRAASKCETKRHIHSSSSMENSHILPTPHTPETPSCSTTVLVLVMHSGCVLDVCSEAAAKKSDVTTFRGVFDTVLRQHYPSLWSHIIIKLVHCPALCTEALGILSSLSPYSFDISQSTSDMPNIVDVPIGAISLLAVLPPDYRDAINKTIMAANEVYHDFLKSNEGVGFAGQIVLLADSMGSLLAYEALCVNNLNTNLNAKEQLNDLVLHLSTPCADTKVYAFDFEVSDLFIFGSPLSMVLAAKKLKDPKIVIQRPKCNQVYNMFHPTDPVSSRLEPLLSARFSILPPVNVPRYAKYPLGDGQSLYLSEVMQFLSQNFHDSNTVFIPRRVSDSSVHSVSSDAMETVLQSTENSLQSKWWGLKRLDYALYCPEGLSNFPSNALPHLFHASYWESPDVVAFILREIGKFENFTTDSADVNNPSNINHGYQREKWIRKRTSVKLKNVAANHRANDVIVLDGREKCLSARFMYGPLDVITLHGEKVDIYIMKDPPEWSFLSTEITDKNGRIIYQMPEKLNYGIYSIKMIVRGDHTFVDFNLAVVPPHTECVVFSIDGSFTASMSVTGRDPKVRAGAVDVCRHWHELGYLLIYVTGRPDMQKHRVVSWLNQHNFPHGLFSFADGLSTDPLGHKTAYLNNLIQMHDICIMAAYGSSKDINVYANLGLRSDQIFIVGKVSKKLQIGATILSDGYAAHLANLQAVGGSRPAKGNARMVIPRSSLHLLSQNMSYRWQSNNTGLCSAVHSGYLKRKSYYLPKK